MHIEFLVEEPSAEVVLNNILPKILRKEHTYRIHSHQGKMDLLKKLPNKLKGYQKSLPLDWKIVILIDRDKEDCYELKSKLESIARNAGLYTKTNPDYSGNSQVINRIVIEELEAWFFGDIDAIHWEFQRVPLSLARKSKYRNPDNIAGGAAEALEFLLKKYGYYSTGMPKIETARKISGHMNHLLNRSKSFQVFQKTISEI